MEFTTKDELFEQSVKLFTDAQDLLKKADITAEDMGNAKKMIADGTELRERSKMLAELEALRQNAEDKATEQAPNPQKKDGKFRTFGEFLIGVRGTLNGMIDQRLVYKTYKDGSLAKYNKTGWPSAEQKDLLENTGASGGFLVPPEFLPQLQMVTPLMQLVEQRAMVIPMSGRVVQIPVLDQTGTGTTGSHYYGGVYPQWIEEGTVKTETDPAFRQMELVAHKLVCYTEVSDELLADSAISLEALLGQIFGGAIANEKEYTYMLGTGAGQPLGVIIAPATIAVARAAAGAIGIGDIFNLLSQFQGSSPIWIAHQSAMPQILALNGPAGNPSYVWIGNGRDQMPTTLMGYPIFFVENAAVLGQRGDIGIYDFSKYLVGNRQGTTIESSKHYRFKYDLTAWRAVSRVDGRPWLSTPITYRDGTTQVSPFVVLDTTVAT